MLNYHQIPPKKQTRLIVIGYRLIYIGRTGCKIRDRLNTLSMNSGKKC